jgi:phage terminase small subunit
VALTAKQQMFCREYLVDLNGTQAAIRAGYSKKTAQEQAARLLSNVIVKEYVQSLMDERSERVEITADYVLTSIHEITERCKQGVPVLVDGEPTGEWKFEPNAALKGCELLGKHLKLFTDKVDVGGQSDNPINATVTFVNGQLPDTK